MSWFSSYIVFIVVIGVVAVAAILVWQNEKNEKIRSNISSGAFIDADEFLREWKINGSGNRKGSVGYKYNDGPGCYVIQIFNSKPTADNVHYDDIYIGQSVKACQRVRNHLTGHGNGDVYAGVRNGKYVRVQIVPCSKEQMNQVEKDLIAAFNATSSYNRTRGGSANRF